MITSVLRPATPADLPLLGEIYTDAVLSQGPEAYSEEQVQAWARWPTDHPAEFRRRLNRPHAWIAEVDGVAAAFAQLIVPDHVDFLYTRGEYAGQGLATQLHTKLKEIALAAGAARLRTEASLLSRPVFTTFGYRVTATEQVERGGETFIRFHMTRRLRLAPPAVEAAAIAVSDYEPAFAIAPTAAALETVVFSRYDEKNPGWFSGTDVRGVHGYFPQAWFEIDESAHRAVAQRDYTAAELRVKVGDRVHRVVTVDGWHLVVSADGHREGWLPAECLAAV